LITDIQYFRQLFQVIIHMQSQNAFYLLYGLYPKKLRDLFNGIGILRVFLDFIQDRLYFAVAHKAQD